MVDTVHAVLDEAVQEADRLRRNLKKKSSKQVTAAAETALIKATALAWFNKHRAIVLSRVSDDDLAVADTGYKGLLQGADRATARVTYDGTLKSLRSELTALKGLAVEAGLQPAASTPDASPDFSTLVSDPKMQAILVRRWDECVTCVQHGAPLAATVMMGGLLEALLLARLLREPDKTAVFASASAPTDKAGKAAPLQQWTLRNYLDVAHELAWISKSTRDIGAVVRDYRNYIHPQKELSHGVDLKDGDSALFWEIAKAMVRQLL
jgi:hypothetical protein